MKRVVIRRGFVGIALAFVLGLTVTNADALEVVSCLYDRTTPHISDDPRECPDQKIDVISIKTAWTNGTTLGSAGGGAVDKAKAGPLVIVKRIDQASPKIFLALATVQRLQGVLVVIFDQKGGAKAPRLFSILIETAFVASIDDSSADGKDDALEMVGVVYGKATLRDDASGAQASWNFVSNSTD